MMRSRNRFSRLAPVLALCAFALGLTPATHARTWRVPDDAPTIAAAIDSAVAGDVVELACGTYYEHDLALKAGITVRSEDGTADCATIDAENRGRVFTAEDLPSQTLLHGLTITGGLAAGTDGAGGGILARNASLRVLLCRLEGNAAGYNGGGIQASDSDLLIYSSELVGNVAVGGSGGAVDLYNCTGEFFNSRFEANVAVDGAGACLSRSSLLINWCTFITNEAQFFGGALFLVTESDPTIVHCTLAANSAHLGAGMMVADNSVPTVEVNIGAQMQGCVLTPVDELPAETTTLAQNRPNPFNPRTTIAFTLAWPGWVDLRVYDLAGRLVAVLERGEAAAGRQEVAWGGVDRHGRAVPSGTYVYRLEADGQVASRTMQLVR